MKKSCFIKLLVCVVLGLLFSIGLCMCLLPQWNLFVSGVILTSIGFVGLISIGVISFIKNRKNNIKINWKIIGKILYIILSVLVLGLGMSFVLVLNMFVLGIIVGILGIIMLLFIIPMFIGFKKEIEE